MEESVSSTYFANECPEGDGRRAVVLVSGGLDSATVLAMVRARRFAVHALSFDYGQRQRVELERAKALARKFDVAEHLVARIDLRAIGASALTSDIEVPKASAHGAKAHVPVTYVPARNTLFLSYALALAEARGAHDLFLGISQVDYSGYPDCRPAFVEAFERLANVATKAADGGPPFQVHAPLLQKSKADTIRIGTALGVDYAQTHSCYDPQASDMACGVCDACELRRQGFEAAGISDPTPYAPSSAD